MQNIQDENASESIIKKLYYSFFNLLSNPRQLSLILSQNKKFSASPVILEEKINKLKTNVESDHH
jgi:hypothetical protein